MAKKKPLRMEKYDPNAESDSAKAIFKAQSNTLRGGDRSRMKLKNTIANIECMKDANMNHGRKLLNTPRAFPRLLELNEVEN